MTPQEIRDKRNTIVTQARAIAKKAEDEKREMTAEERTNFDKALNDASTLKADLERMERLETEERELAGSRGRKVDPTQPEQRGNGDEKPFTFELRGVKYTINPGQRGYGRTTDGYAAAERSFLRTGNRNEYRTAASWANDVDADGGYLHASQQFVATLIKAIDNMVFARKYATVLMVTTSDTLGAPSLTTDVADADWKTEVQSTTVDAAAQLGTRNLTPNLSTKLAKISRKLLATAAMDPVSLVSNRLAYKFGVTEEKAYLTGDGSAKPLGVFTASASGISTGRDVSTGNTTTSMTFDGLQAAKYSLNAAHRAKARAGCSTATAWRRSPSSRTATASTSGSRPRPRANPTACWACRSTRASTPRTPSRPACTSA
jgi:HK97 family phage major capsid protein